MFFKKANIEITKPGNRVFKSYCQLKNLVYKHPIKNISQGTTANPGCHNKGTHINWKRGVPVLNRESEFEGASD